MAAKKAPKKYPPHLSPAMKSQIDWLTGRIHVGTPDAEVAEDVRRRCKAWPPGLCEEAAEYAVKSHHANLGLYQDVMSGNLGRGRKNPSAPRRKMRPYGNTAVSKRLMRPYGNPADPQDIPIQTLSTMWKEYCTCGSRGLTAKEHDAGCGWRVAMEAPASPKGVPVGELSWHWKKYCTCGASGSRMIDHKRDCAWYVAMETHPANAELKKRVAEGGATAVPLPGGKWVTVDMPSKKNVRNMGALEHMFVDDKHRVNPRKSRRARKNGADIGRIYIVDLAAYNEGHLRGEWITPSSDASELGEQIQQVLKNAKRKGHPVGEEFAIHDYDDFPDLGEYPGAERIAKTVQGLEQIAESSNPDALHALIESEPQYAEDIDSALEYVENNFAGEFDNAEREFVSSLVDDGVLGHEQMKNYFDAEAFGRDVRMDLDEEGEDSWAADLNDEELGEHYLTEVYGDDLDKKTLETYFDDQACFHSMENGGEILVLHKNSKDYVFWNG